MSKLTPARFLAVYFLALCALAPLRPLWLDEWTQLSDTYHVSFSETIDRCALNPGGVPLVYLLQNLVVNTFGHPFYSARFLAILFAVAGMYGLIVLVHLLEPPAADWRWIAIAYAILPIALRYAIEIRQYGPALDFSIWALVLLLLLDRHPTSTFLATAYAAALAACLYSHPFAGGFAIAAHAIWAVGRPSRRYVLTACATSLAAFMPWYLFAQTRWTEAIARVGYRSSFTWKTPLLVLRELSGGGYILTIALLYLAVYGYRLSPISASAKKLLLLTIVVPLPLAVAADLAFHYFFAIRQFLFIVPALCVLAIEGLRQLPKTPRRWLSAALAALALGFDIHWFRYL